MSAQKGNPAGYLFGSVVSGEPITISRLGAAVVPWRAIPWWGDYLPMEKQERLPDSNEQAWDNVTYCENCPYPDCMYTTLEQCKQTRERGGLPYEARIKEAARQNAYYSEDEN